MQENSRRFSAGPDPFGRTWDVAFRWLQTAISIRHSDTVDVKYQLHIVDEPKQEKVLAMQHLDLLELAKELGRPLTDAWCMQLSAHHLKSMIASGEDLEKTLITLSAADLKRAAGVLQPV